MSSKDMITWMGEILQRHTPRRKKNYKQLITSGKRNINLPYWIYNVEWPALKSYIHKKQNWTQQVVCVNVCVRVCLCVYLYVYTYRYMCTFVCA